MQKIYSRILEPGFGEVIGNRGHLYINIIVSKTASIVIRWKIYYYPPKLITYHKTKAATICAVADSKASESYAAHFPCSCEISLYNPFSKIRVRNINIGHRYRAFGKGHNPAVRVCRINCNLLDISIVGKFDEDARFRIRA